MQSRNTIELIPLKDTFTIYKLEEGQEIPPQMLTGGFFSVTSTPEEVSIVTNCGKSFPMFTSEKDWRAFMVEGILDFSLVGILADILQPLKDNDISVFVLSTFNTDYIFVHEKDFGKAQKILAAARNISIKKNNPF